MPRGGERRWSRERIDLGGLGGVRRTVDSRWSLVLHDQMDEILGEVWRQEAWAETEDRIDALVSNNLGPATG
ncbi:hypothetical protein [Candidatus Nephthysia bennettiae]|uniref:Uncharacterized protein n=1 Tax=Candidatus Nephthysia bennettiae TaxID=3127016 RepID=A0A934NF65_9BACT|nr:hypothetical protein [Candidatus Dormibacteraeota bacterium]MBJ7613748.1 hypothetical protein [Candidatus Dormibacteraeota bacterium]